ncbi:MAG: multiprotein bridging factor aMBF1 [Halolamina sp.]
MPQCEMCGDSNSSLTTTKVEGAELELCDDCTEFGTEVRTGSDGDSTTTKYSTSSSSGSSSSGSSGSGSGGSSGSSGGRRNDMFDDMGELATDYDDRIRSARERENLSQEELSDRLNEKASLIRKLERGDILPSDDVQSELERELDISLSGEVNTDTDWESDSGATTTLGDVVKRKD